MDEETIREIAEAAFRRYFGHVELVRLNIRQGLDHDGDPIVDLRFVYDDKRGKVGSLGGDGVLRLLDDVHSQFQADPARDPGFPMPHFIARSELGKRDPVST